MLFKIKNVEYVFKTEYWGVKNHGIGLRHGNRRRARLPYPNHESACLRLRPQPCATCPASPGPSFAPRALTNCPSGLSARPRLAATRRDRRACSDSGQPPRSRRCQLRRGPNRPRTGQGEAVPNRPGGRLPGCPASAPGPDPS